MKDRLREKNFTVINQISELENVHLISCLNVLDRCADPKSLLADMHAALHPKGRVLLALVLPYNHFVERSKKIMKILRFITIFDIFRLITYASRTVTSTLAK